MILALADHPDGVETEPGDRIVYDVDRDEAFAGAGRVDGHALVWELTERPAGDWLLRCDRVDFPPGGVAYRHTHPGGGIRRLLSGSIRIEGPDGLVEDYGPGSAWFEGADHPVKATASKSEPSAFVRVMVLPREWQDKRTIRYLDPADEEKPKLQKPTVYFDRPIQL